MARLSRESRRAYERYLRELLGAPHIRARHAGTCYPADRDGVLRMVRAHFEEGVGALPDRAERDGRRGPLPGLVVPHLDFRVGGPVYSHGYRELLSFEPADLYVILGVGHRCRADLSVSRKGYETVLGEVPCDEAFVGGLVGRLSFPLDVEPLSHHDEHSIEFAVIYLQAMAALFPEYAGFSIVPVLCGGMHEEIVRGSSGGSAFEAFARGLGETIAGDGRRVCVLGSIDGSHVGPRFDHPFEVDAGVRRKIEGMDRAAFGAAGEGDPEAFLRVFAETYNAQGFDGVGVMYVMLHLFRRRAAFELLRYHQWYERRDRSMVTLASGVFRPVA